MAVRLLRVAIMLFVAPAIPAVAQTPEFDVLLLGSRVLDGSGNPWRRADVGVRDGRIVAVGRLRGVKATRVIDASRHVIVPGFIDLHSHADGPIYGPRGLRSPDARRRAAPNLVMQGITTVVVNQDGRSAWPIADQRAQLERLKIGPNAVLLVGHGTVRRRVMGEDFRRPATRPEVERMQALVQQAMREGAHGMSAGLEYAPGRWSTTDEVVALTREIAPFGGVYISHQRSEGADPMWYWPSEFSARPPSLLDAVRETITIGERTGAVVVASHVKAKGADYWGASAAAIHLIENARARGVAIYADQYPYATTGSDGNTVLIPEWVYRGTRVRENGRRDRAALLRDVLANDSLAAALREDIAHEIARRGGAERVVVFDYPDSSYIGRSLADIAAMRNVHPVEAATALQLEGYATRPGGARVRGFSLSERDIEEYARQPWTATATDGWVVLPEDGPTHVRVYGTVPRKIRYYAMERGVVSVSNAVRSGTSLPAQILGLNDRGMVREGYRADLVVLDLDELRDNATFFEPHRFPSGIAHVMVNGTFVVEHGELTWALPGIVVTPRPSGGSGTTGSW
jgi:N-acyl-D-amino-acid deacylase